MDTGCFALEIFTGDDYIAVPLTPRRFETRVGAGPNRRGLLVTFLKANPGAMASAANEEFDKVLSAYGEIFKPASCQNHRGTAVMNGNRYCVIAPGENTVPGTIVVFNHLNCRKVAVYTRYRGQKWYCKRCGEEHVGACVTLHEFYAAQKARAQVSVNLKVLSDSTFRRAEQGTFNHLANAARDDPQIKERNDLAVVTPGNDYKRDSPLTDAEFVFAVDKGVEKLQDEIVKTPDRTLSIFYLRDSPTIPFLPLDQIPREKYLAQELGRVASDQIRVVPVDADEIEKDVTSTNILLAAIDKSYEADLILNEKFTTTERLYAGVQSVYLYGCLNCEAGLCPTPLGISPNCVTLLGTYIGAEKWAEFVRFLPPDPPPTLIIDPANWRDPGGGNGQVDKRPRSPDSRGGQGI